MTPDGTSFPNAQRRPQATFQEPSPKHLGYEKGASKRNSRWELKCQKRHQCRPPVEGGFHTGTRCRIFRYHRLSMNSDKTYSNRFQSTICGQQQPSDARTSNQQQTQYSGLRQTVNTKCWVSFESSRHLAPPKFFPNFRGFDPSWRGKREGQKRHSIAPEKVARWAKILPRSDLKKSTDLESRQTAESF